MPGSRGCCWNWACYCIVIASSRRGCHRKVQSRGRSEQRIRWIFAVEVFVFWLDFTMGSIRIYPDRAHSEINIKTQKHVNSNSKNTPDTLLWSTPRLNFPMAYGNPGERKRLQCNSKPDSNRNPAIQAFESWSATSKKPKPLFSLLH